MRVAITAFLGTATILGAFGYLLLNPSTAANNPALVALAVLVGIVGVIGALVKVARSKTDEDVAPAPWDTGGELVESAPERSPADDDLSGEQLAGVVEEAGETARDEGMVAAGIDVVRPNLRKALLGVLVQGGTDRATAKAMLANGTWTEDRTAAATLDEANDHPGWSLLERFEAWLFPEQVLRREVQTSMQAIAQLAKQELPTVPGQHAPRTVPVLTPTLEDLRRGADGHLQRAVDPLGARQGSAVDGATVVDGADTVEGSHAGSENADSSTAETAGSDQDAEATAPAADATPAGDEATPAAEIAGKSNGGSLADIRIGSGPDDVDPEGPGE